MPTTTARKPGDFCWTELGTTDTDSAKRFYGGLFGWTYEDNPMGPDMVYTMFKKEDADIGGGYKLGSQMLEQGVPPHWLLYVAVKDADASGKKAAELGGTVMNGPFDVGEAGRMAVIRDPAGAVFAIWQSKNHPGMGISGEDGAFCWADLSVPHQKKAADFYSALFGWELLPEKGATGGYLHIQNDGDMIGGIPSEEQVNPNVPPHWTLYFQTSDCDSLTAKAKDLGAHVLMPPMSIPTAGRMSVIADLEGAAFALYEPQHAA